MFCRNCGTELAEGSRFCASCGAQQGTATDTERTASTATPPPAAAPVKRHNWFRRHKITTVVLALVILIFASSIVTSTSSGGGGSSTSSNGTPKLTGTVEGALTRDSIALEVASADKQALKRITWSNVFCGWDGSHVTVHIAFHNQLAAHVSVEVQPRYSIHNGGLHGTSIDNRTSFGVPANGTYVWWGNAGSPAGVTPGAKIGTCAPQLTNIGPG
jgi:hypothetical protein